MYGIIILLNYILASKYIIRGIWTEFSSLRLNLWLSMIAQEIAKIEILSFYWLIFHIGLFFYLEKYSRVLIIGKILYLMHFLLGNNIGRSLNWSFINNGLTFAKKLENKKSWIELHFNIFYYRITFNTSWKIITTKILIISNYLK